MEEKALSFIDKFGMVFEQQGVSRSAGLVMGWLMMAATPQSLDDISDGLSLSKASVSLHTRLLEQMSIIRKVPVRGDRKTYYQITENTWSLLMENGANKLRLFQNLAEEGEEIADSPVVKTRFAEMRRNFSFIVEGYEELLKRYREIMGKK